MMDELFTPYKIGEYTGVLAVWVQPCPRCKRPMLGKPTNIFTERMFPDTLRMQLRQQMGRAGWTFRGTATDASGRNVCEACQEAGDVTFICYRCKRELPTTKIQWGFGSPADHLCTNCYAITPAKEWDALVKEIEEEHQYDWG
jgi:hypothetical protein